jgi:hypothetical protein
MLKGTRLWSRKQDQGKNKPRDHKEELLKEGEDTRKIRETTVKGDIKALSFKKELLRALLFIF